MKPILYTNPLAARLRPHTLADYIGQTHILGLGKPLRRAIEEGRLHAMILWGPPGTGKTTLAAVMAKSAHAHFITCSAIEAGVKEIRMIANEAKQRRSQTQTVLFIDEIHRFSKSQQDALLPYVEEGVFVLIGATTENPSFELNNALLSRTHIYILKPLTDDELGQILTRALSDMEKGFGNCTIDFPLALQKMLINAAEGDARQVLNYLEILMNLALTKNQQATITVDLLSDVIEGHGVRQFDKKGDIFYDQISALHKSVRGSSPDAALYWLARMLDGGCDPLYITRRLVRIASEDIGNADPRALQIALNAWDVFERLGRPEGELALAHAISYLAVAPKSNAVYLAFKKARQDVITHGSLPVPLHLRNAPTKLLKQLHHGESYRYAHDEPEAYAAGENYFPLALGPRRYYKPVKRGLEQKIAEKMQRLQALDQKSKEKTDT